MQLKLRRTQREGGIVSKSVIFCLDARVEFAPEEKQSITRYKLQNEVIYNSEAQNRLLDKSAAHQDGSLSGNLKSLALAAFALTKLHITIAGLERGQHIECKSLDELLGAEDAIMTACQNLRGYLDTAMTFDGREVLVDFSAAQPILVAQAVTPQPLLAIPAASAPVAAPASLEDASANAEPYADEEIRADVIDFEAIAAWFGNPLSLVAVVVGVVLLLILLSRCS